MLSALQAQQPPRAPRPSSPPLHPHAPEEGAGWARRLSQGPKDQLEVTKILGG